jgi:LacI family transcriptional regulator
MNVLAELLGRPLRFLIGDHEVVRCPPVELLGVLMSSYWPTTRSKCSTSGYVPSQLGRSLSTRVAGQVGIVVGDLRNPFYLEVLDKLHEALRSAEVRMLVLTPDTDDRVPLERLVDGSLDGAILTATDLHSPLPGELAGRSIPFVLLNREIDDAPGDVCVVDNEAGGALVARELLDLGHRSIAAVFGPQRTSTGRDREAGFRAVLDRDGVALPVQRWRRAPFDFEAGRRLTLELLESRPTAIFCANDILALGAHEAISSRGLRMPQDITLIGFDDVLLARWQAFQLTTVSQDIGQMVEGQHRAPAGADRRRTRRAASATTCGAARAPGPARHPRAPRQLTATPAAPAA